MNCHHLSVSSESWLGAIWFVLGVLNWPGCTLHQGVGGMGGGGGVESLSSKVALKSEPLNSRRTFPSTPPVYSNMENGMVDGGEKILGFVVPETSTKARLLRLPGHLFLNLSLSLTEPSLDHTRRTVSLRACQKVVEGGGSSV